MLIFKENILENKHTAFGEMSLSVNTEDTFEKIERNVYHGNVKCGEDKKID